MSWPEIRCCVDRADDRHVADLIDERQIDRAELCLRRKLRRSAALRPDRVADKRGQAVGHHVDRGAGHDLVGALVDRGIAVDEREDDAAATPARSPSHTLPVKVAAAADANAPTRILPSSPMSTMPERSDQRPARQARMSGTARRMPEAKTTMNASNHSMPPPVRWAAAPCAARAASRQGGGTCARARRRIARRDPG